ncbi:MAG: metallophosphoesterase family protein [Planctomycetota bacterium]|nr:metallophosphoesterase family protein [Planctomycetota bacterium]
MLGLVAWASIAPAQDKDALAAAKRSVGLVGANPVHCRVTFHSNPATEAILSWSTADPGTTHAAYYDTYSRGGNAGSYRFHQRNTRNGRFTPGSEAVKGLAIYYHHAYLKGLKPSTTYYCVMVSDSKTSREFHFRTGPRDGRKTQIVFGGDSRSDHPDRQRVNQFLSQTLEAHPDILAMVHGGDYVATGNDLVQWALWLTHQQLTTTKSNRLLPVIPVRGNHEGIHPQFNEVFGWPGDKQNNYYTSRIGSLTSLVVLNTETVTAGDQRKFLEATLQKNRSRRWQLATYHRPAFPAVKQPSHALQHWVPLFERFRLDLALEADGHVIKRSVPILNGKHDSEGVVYIGEGGLGVKQRDPDPGRWYLRHPGMTSKGHHIHLITITKTRLLTQVLTVHDGKVIDTWLRTPRKRN